MFPTRPSLMNLAVRGAVAATAALALGCATGPTEETHRPPTGDSFLLTPGQVSALDSVGTAVVTANPGNGSLKSLLDSTLQVLTAGVTATRVNVTTDLTTAPLYFVGIHRVIERATGSFSTWTVVGMDDPEVLTSVMEVSGFAQNQTATAPSSVSGPLGTGAVNALFLNVATGGVVTQWNGNNGTISFTSDAPTGACPVANPSANMTCTIETMHVRFDVTAANPNGGSTARHGVIATEVAIPTMRLTYTGP
jgi:hypothetical protein